MTSPAEGIRKVSDTQARPATYRSGGQGDQDCWLFQGFKMSTPKTCHRIYDACIKFKINILGINDLIIYNYTIYNSCLEL